MDSSTLELWRKISDSGLASPLQCRSWAAELAQTQPDLPQENPLLVLQGLVDLNKLSKYQAKVLSGQAPEWPLKLGPYHVLSRVKDKNWTDWSAVAKIDLTKGEAQPTLWGRIIDQSHINDLRPASPSLKRAMQLAQIETPGLQKTIVPELVSEPKSVLVLMEPLKNAVPLSHQNLQNIERATQLKLITSLAQSLAALHNNGIVHGNIAPHNVWLAEDFSYCTLSCDPICGHPVAPGRPELGLIGSHIDGKGESTQFLAPEFATPGQVPTRKTDIFGLGATWHYLITGRPVDANAKKIDLPEPILKCLLHCTAPNSQARFADANALLKAIALAEAVIKKGKINRPTPADAPPSAPVATPPRKSPTPKSPTPKTQPDLSQTDTIASSKSEPKSGDGVKSVVPPDEPRKPLPDKARNLKPAQAKTSEPKTSEPKTSEPKDQVKQDDGQPRETSGANQRRTPELSTHEDARSQGTSTAQVSAANVAADKSAGPKSRQSKPTNRASNSKKTAESPNRLTHKQASPNGPPQEQAKAQPQADKSTAVAPQTTEDKADGVADSETPSTATPNEPLRPSRPLAPESSALGRGKQTRRRKRKTNPYFIPLIGAFGAILLVLLGLAISGVLSPNSNVANNKDRPAYEGNVEPPSTISDPLASHFEIVSDNDSLAWAPPRAPESFSRELLPPGAQVYIALRPSYLASVEENKRVFSALEDALSNPWNELASRVGFPLTEIDHCVVGLFEPETPGGTPLTAIRVELATPQPLQALKQQLDMQEIAKVEQTTFFTNDKGDAFYAQVETLEATQTISEYCVGPLALIKEAIESGGDGGPLSTQLGRLWKNADRQAAVSILASPRFLFAGGRQLLDSSPPRLRTLMRELFPADTRGLLLQMDFQDRWYYELQVVGASDQDAGGIASSLGKKLQRMPARIEQWFVDETPHPFWRALALRFPQMLRAFQTQTRVGVENGSVVVNGYMPSNAAPNILLASWIALQEAATIASPLGYTGSPSSSPANAAMPTQQYLDQKITVSFDQEPIEVALAIVGEEANDGLPSGQPKVKFVLDGGAFENDGITRNQQLRDYSFSGSPVRTLLTEICKRGNPTQGVTDLTSAEQALLWVAIGDPVTEIRLTTRKAAAAANQKLPREFRPEGG